MCGFRDPFFVEVRSVRLSAQADSDTPKETVKQPPSQSATVTETYTV